VTAGAPRSNGAAPLLSVEDLSVSFETASGTVCAVDELSYEVHEGRTLGIVGASGAGKTVSSLTALGLTRARNARIQGRIMFGGRDLVSLPDGELRKLRGNEIAMLFEDPRSSLHPLHTVGRQLTEAVLAHRDVTEQAARDRAFDLLELVAIPDAHRWIDAHPRELSDGMCRRATIAIALANQPNLLIADEPTAALDVTVQVRIVALLRRLQQRFGMAMVITTRDPALAAALADETVVMQAGRIVKDADAGRIQVPTPSPGRRPLAAAAEPLMELHDVSRRFPGDAAAVDGVSLQVFAGETLGIVGETGCGKSTLARLIARLLDTSSGQILFQAQDVTGCKGARLRTLRRELQMIFGDPHSSLNPGRRAGSIIAEPFAIHGMLRGAGERKQRVQELMQRVGLNPEHHDRYPHDFSPEQRQLIGVARAIALEPKLIVADEPAFELDGAGRAELLELLVGLQHELELTLILLARDPSALRGVCDRVAVMYLGKVVELASSDALYSSPRHPYTGALLSAVPVLRGEMPSLANRPAACRLHTRCPKVQAVCGQDEPALEPKGPSTVAACHFPLTDKEVGTRLQLKRDER
jgi:oligopeptide/dipeptide ABC transporter ATP-binding protein